MQLSFRQTLKLPIPTFGLVFLFVQHQLLIRRPAVHVAGAPPCRLTGGTAAATTATAVATPPPRRQGRRRHHGRRPTRDDGKRTPLAVTTARGWVAARGGRRDEGPVTPGRGSGGGAAGSGGAPCSARHVEFLLSHRGGDGVCSEGELARWTPSWSPQLALLRAHHAGVGVRATGRTEGHGPHQAVGSIRGHPRPTQRGNSTDATRRLLPTMRPGVSCAPMDAGQGGTEGNRRGSRRRYRGTAWVAAAGAIATVTPLLVLGTPLNTR